MGADIYKYVEDEGIVTQWFDLPEKVSLVVTVVVF